MPALRAQATFGIAKTWESLGKLDSAIRFYTEVTTEWPDTVYAQMSTRRLDDLKRVSTKEVYDKFAQFDPKPKFTQPSGGIPGLDKIPAEGPVYTPGAIKEPGVEEKKTEKVDNKAEEKKPEDKTEKPVDSGQSAGGEKPADSQPAPGANKPTP